MRFLFPALLALLLASGAALADELKEVQRLHAAGQTHVLRATMKELEEMLERESARLQRLVHTRRPEPMRAVGLDDVVRPLVVSRQAQGQLIVWHADGRRVWGRDDDLAVVLNVLLDNAAQHAPGQPVSITTRAVDGLVEEWRRTVHEGRAEDQGFGTWLNIPSKVAQVAAVRALAHGRRAADLAAGRLVMALCPGLIDTDASRPWFEDMAEAQTPAQAAAWPVKLVLADRFDPAFYGELVQFGRVLPWASGIPVAHRASA